MPRDPAQHDPTSDSPSDLLQPARYQVNEGRRAFAPNRRWGLLLVGLGLIAGFFLVQIYGRVRAREALREELLARYDAEATPTAGEVHDFIGRLNGWITEAGREQAAPATFAADGFRWSEMHDWRGLYLRIEADRTADPETIAATAREMTRDAVTRCLGVSPVSARGLYDLARFLEPAWADGLRAEDDTMRLRVLEDEMNRRLSRDVPLVRSMLRSHYFLLVVTRGGRSERAQPGQAGQSGPSGHSVKTCRENTSSQGRPLWLCWCLRRRISAPPATAPRVSVNRQAAGPPPGPPGADRCARLAALTPQVSATP